MVNNCTCVGGTFFLVTLAFACCGQNISPDVNLQQDPNGMPGELVWSITIQIGSDLVLPAAIEVTAKGNGSLSVGESSLGKVYDAHDDGATFDGYLADITFKDINDDGFKDIVVSGIINIHHEKFDDVQSHRSFVKIYLYDSEQQTFKNVFDSKDPNE